MDESVERTKTVKFKSFPKVTLFEEYRLFIEDTARFSDRRQTFSNLMIAMNGFLVGAIYVVLRDLSPQAPWKVMAMVPLLGAGLAASCVWWKLLNWYEDIIRNRTDFLNKIECEAGKCGEDGMYHKLERLYPPDGPIRGFTHIEKCLPYIFVGVHSVFMLGIIVVAICHLCLMPVNCLCPLS
jgi:xanthosine utilization system XapX-like protein